MCEDEGLIHVTGNKRTLGHVICNCCSDCCLNWPSVRTGLGKFVVPSRFRAKVDAEELYGLRILPGPMLFRGDQHGGGGGHRSH